MDQLPTGTFNFLKHNFCNSTFRGNGAVLGMLKIGPKKLFLLDRKGQQNELDPLCVLDFYIHESCQRMGLGKVLFTHFLEVMVGLHFPIFYFILKSRNQS